MSLRRRTLITGSALAVAALPPQPGHAATPAVDPGALAHCAGITAADERLACYDSLSRPKPEPAAPPGAAATQTPAAAKAATGAAPAPAPKTAVTAPGAGAAGAMAAPAEKAFGLGNHPPPVAEGPDHIQAKVTGLNTDRLGNVRVLLDNGQVWTFTASDALLRVGDAVTIKRGALGSFLLTTPSHHTYRTVRMQ